MFKYDISEQRNAIKNGIFCAISIAIERFDNRILINGNFEMRRV